MQRNRPEKGWEMLPVINKAFIVALLFAMIIPYAVCGQDEDNKAGKVKVPEGMELQKVGSLNIVVPKGTKVKRDGDLIVIESISEYIARNLEDMRTRIQELESQQRGFEDKISELNERIDSLKTKTLESEVLPSQLIDR